MRKEKRALLDTAKKRPALDTIKKKPIPIEEFLSLDKHRKIPDQSFMPYGTTRLPVFYPISKKKIREGFLEKVEKHNESWGCFTYTGERLRAYDLETLIAINLIVMKRSTLNLIVGPGEICDILGTTINPDSVAARRRSIFRLGSAVFRRYLPKGYSHSLIGSILMMFVENTDDGRFALSIHPFFYRELLADNFAKIDVRLLMRLRGDVAKLAYVFYTGQKKDGYIKLRTLLCDICNLPDSTSRSVLRKKAKKVHEELVKKGFLSEYVIRMDGVTPKRAPKKLAGAKSQSFFHVDKSKEPKDVKDPNSEITNYLIKLHDYLTVEKEYNTKEKSQFAQAAKKFKAAMERGDGEGVVAEVYNEAGELEPAHVQYIQVFFEALRWKFKKNLDLTPGTWCSNRIWESVWLPYIELSRPDEIDEESCSKTRPDEEVCYNEDEHGDGYDPSEEYPD